ncbi:MAG: CpsB/CapC family capsule biosynthesis tyrosine phosphatase [Syntrophales bacterium]|nr:CpsB/CapC family capsule biosynthesis tyrosine phosphatase [Syntrophales bacterium]
MIDMHSHILPGLDDGAADWDQALAMARVAVEDGIEEMVCTPHWVLGKYENDRETVLRRFAEFEERLAAEKIPLKVHTGMELRIDTSIPDRLKAGRLLTLNNGSRYVLLELPDENMPANLHEFFWNLQINGYRPILSHVERNPYFRGNPHRLLHWVENGILTQITAASLLEGFAEEIREFALFLVEHRLVQMLVTDTHSLRMRKPQLSGARRVIENLAGPETAARMVCDTPRLILKGEHVPVIDPLPLQEERRKKWWSWGEK